MIMPCAWRDNGTAVRSACALSFAIIRCNWDSRRGVCFSFLFFPPSLWKYGGAKWWLFIGRATGHSWDTVPGSHRWPEAGRRYACVKSPELQCQINCQGLLLAPARAVPPLWTNNPSKNILNITPLLIASNGGCTWNLQRCVTRLKMHSWILEFRQPFILQRYYSSLSRPNSTAEYMQ